MTVKQLSEIQGRMARYNEICELIERADVDCLINIRIGDNECLVSWDVYRAMAMAGIRVPFNAIKFIENYESKGSD